MASAEVRQPAVPSPGPATGLAELALGGGIGSVAWTEAEAEAGADELGFGFGALVVAGVLTGAEGELLDADVVSDGATEGGGVVTGSDTEVVSAALGSTGLAVGCD